MHGGESGGVGQKKIPQMRMRVCHFTYLTRTRSHAISGRARDPINGAQPTRSTARAACPRNVLSSPSVALGLRHRPLWRHISPMSKPEARQSPRGELCLPLEITWPCHPHPPPPLFLALTTPTHLYQSPQQARRRTKESHHRLSREGERRKDGRQQQYPSRPRPTTAATKTVAPQLRGAHRRGRRLGRGGRGPLPFPGRGQLYLLGGAVQPAGGGVTWGESLAMRPLRRPY